VQPQVVVGDARQDRLPCRRVELQLGRKELTQRALPVQPVQQVAPEECVGREVPSLRQLAKQVEDVDQRRIVGVGAEALGPLEPGRRSGRTASTSSA